MRNMKLRTIIPSYVCILIFLLVVAYLGSKALTAYNDNKPLTQNNCIIIDAGHGGIDGGAISVSGKLESDINLQIAVRLNDLLHLLGISTVMVRTTNESIHSEGDTIAQIKMSDLKNRVKIANSVEGAILVSIHQNYFNQSKYNGAQVFSAKTTVSYQLAKTLQGALVSALDPHSNRKAKKAEGIYLMDKINCTGILVECGFISNPDEEQKLLTATYQNKLCCVIATVLSQYINDNPVA